MAESSGFFNAELVNGQYDREYLAEAFAKYFSLFIANGVFPNPSDGLQVFENTTADMNVLMHPGYAWIDGYWYKLDGNLTLAIDPADGVLNRIDSIVVRWGLEKRSIYAQVVKGTPASKPTAPEVMRSPDFSDLCVAYIRVDAGTTKIMQSMITDTRMNSSLCGIVTGVVQSIDTTTLFEQYQAALKEFQDTRMVEFDEWQEQEKSDFDTWFETIKGTLDGDTAGNLLNLITQETADRKAADAAIESKIGINATAVYEESTVKITAPEGLVVVTFLAPSDCRVGDRYTLNGDALTLTDLNGEPVEDAWKQGSPVTLTISGNKAFFKAGGMGKLPSDLAPLCPNFKVERNGGKVKITADKIQLNSYTNMVSGGVWAWGKTRPVKPTGENTKLWSRAELITTGKPYDGLYLGDVTPSDAVNETILWLPENQSGSIVLVPFLVLSVDYLGGVYICRNWLWNQSQYLPTGKGYDGSSLDTLMETTYGNSVIHESVRSQIIECDYPVMTRSGLSSVKRKIVSPSIGELGYSSVDDGTAMTRWTTESGRICKTEDGTAQIYWSRSEATDTFVYMITATGVVSSEANTLSRYTRPAFVLPKDFKIQQRPDGSYTVWNEQGLMALSDVEPSTEAKKITLQVKEAQGVKSYTYLLNSYDGVNTSILSRDKVPDSLYSKMWTNRTFADYSNSDIMNLVDSWATSAISTTLAAVLNPIDIIYQKIQGTVTKVEGTVNKVAFLPSAFNTGGSTALVTEGSKTEIPYFKNTANKKFSTDSGSAVTCIWTRDVSKIALNVPWAVTYEDSDGSLHERIANSISGIPCGIVLISVKPDSPIRQLADGSYDLVPEDPALATQTASTLADDEVPLEIEIDWPESDPLIARQWVYNTKGQYQTMLLGGVVSTEDAPPFALPEFTGNHAIFGDEVEGRIELYESGDLTLYPGTYDLFLVGGGGSGIFGGYDSPEQSAWHTGLGGGGSGYTETFIGEKVDRIINVECVVGAGGAVNTTANNQANLGSSTYLKFSTGSMKEAEGGGNYNSSPYVQSENGQNGGSGGGAGMGDGSTGGVGGSDGSNGGNSPYGPTGGIGQGTTTKAFGEDSQTLYAGGGGGPGLQGGSGGGGRGAKGSQSGNTSATSGTPNTGSGGGAGYKNARYNLSAGAGGSGLIIIRWSNV